MTTNVRAVLDDPLSQELLDSKNLLRLGYTALDGSPRVIPIGFLWNGTAVVVCTAPTAPKVAALAKQPRVALTIDTMGPPAKELLLRGTAVGRVQKSILLKGRPAPGRHRVTARAVALVNAGAASVASASFRSY